MPADPSPPAPNERPEPDIAEPVSSDFEILTRRSGYDGFLQLDRYEVRQRRFDGSLSPAVEREVLVPGACIGVLLYDPARDAVVLIEQLRLPALLEGFPAVQVEIVAGRIDAGETPAAAAAREVEEETGLRLAGPPQPIARLLTSPGYNRERLDLFWAEVDSRTAEGVHGLASEQEDIRILVLPAADFIAESAAGSPRLGNLFTAHAALWLAANRARLRAVPPDEPETRHAPR